MSRWSALILLFPLACHAAPECEGVPISTDQFIVAETRLSGHPARLALDPIRNVLLERQFTEAVGIEVLDAWQVGYEGRVTIGGAGAQEQEPGFAVGLTLEAGQLQEALPPVVVVDLRNPLGSSFADIDGLLGTDLFVDHVLDIDMPSACLRLVPRESFEAPGTPPLEVTRRRHRPVVTGRIDFPEGVRHELSFLLDFGMSGGVRLSTRYVDEHQLDDRLPTTVPDSMETGLGGELRSLETRAAEVKVGEASWRDITVRLARETQGADADPPWDGLIGVGLLKTRRLVYDPTGNRLWIL